MRARERKSRAINEEELKENQEEKRIEARIEVPSKSGPSLTYGGSDRAVASWARGVSVSVHVGRARIGLQGTQM